MRDIRKMSAAMLSLSLLVLVFWRTGSFAALGAAPKYCWFGGVLALAITVTVMLGMGRLGPTLAVATILIAQLATAAAIDAFGIMGTEKLAFGWSKWAGLALMTGGVLLNPFRYSGLPFFRRIGDHFFDGLALLFHITVHIDRHLLVIEVKF